MSAKKPHAGIVPWLAMGLLPLLGCLLAACQSPGGEPNIDLRQRDVTWPTYDGEFDRGSRPAIPPEPEEEGTE